MEVIPLNLSCVDSGRRKLIFLSYFVLLSLLFGPRLVYSQPELRVITEDWAPYNYRDQGKVVGFSTEIVHAVMDELGEHYPIEIYPGARGDRMLKTLPNVMHFSLFRTPERENRFKWVGPISKQAVYFYKRKDNPKAYRSIQDIKQAKLITVPHKGLVASRVAALGITNVIKLSEREKQFSLLFSDRAELLVNVSPLGVAHYLKMMGKPADSLVATEVKLVEFPLYIACSKEIPDEVIQRWQKALDKVKASDKYQQIYKKYLM